MSAGKQYSSCQTEDPWENNSPCVLGIDEAGRGPVLGPMVYSAAFCPVASLSALKRLGANDSKQLKEEQREALRKKIDEAPFIKTLTKVLTADSLSTSMLRKNKYNLNAISHDTALQLVQDAIDLGFNISEVYVDTVGDPERYASKFREQFDQLTKVVVAKKADATYPIVGAASIIAKTTRDRHIRTWVFPEQERSSHFEEAGPNTVVKFSENTGSGYPSDPTTKKWMEGNVDSMFGFPTFVRFSWGTTKTILLKEAVIVEWECDEDEDEPEKKEKKVPKTKNIMSFFSSKKDQEGKSQQLKKRKTSNAPRELPKYLRSASLKRVTTII